MPSRATIEVLVTSAERHAALAADVRAGLTATPKWLAPVWFYDERGSRLFDEITRLPEYYLTRAERSILQAHAGEIASVSAADTLVELGSGTSEKTRLLLDAMSATGQLRRFAALDVSEEVLREAAEAIGEAYGVDVVGVVGDFSRHLGCLPRGGRRLVAFLGSTIGNLAPSQRRQFLTDLDEAMDRDDQLLLGTDLVKSRERLLRAYDDRAGVTAEFNRNVLRVLNAELGASFRPERFAHVARWDEAERWVEMRLRSLGTQRVAVPALDLEVAFADGEELRTEISTKFTPAQVEDELAAAGFAVEKTWTDAANDFLLTLARPDR